jgi:hypothetical protein
MITFSTHCGLLYSNNVLLHLIVVLTWPPSTWSFKSVRAKPLLIDSSGDIGSL